jgi:hypothetical protein
VEMIAGTALARWLGFPRPGFHPVLKSYVWPAGSSRKFRGCSLKPLDWILTENYLRWHSDLGSASRLPGKADPDDRFHARGVSPCFDSNNRE